ncbi:MAG: STAS domain-containing protein [Ruminiclostridium sp.]|nr:STAS domain-containing protein [Ruminiclostridium sp.]
MSSKFSFSKVRENDELTYIITGRVDTETAPQLDSDIKPELNSIKKLVLDLSGVEYISSSGLRVLLNLNKSLSANKGKFVIRNPSQMVNDVFEITNFSNILNIENK